VGVRGFVLTAESVQDVVIRGLELRHNRQPGGQWPMVSVGQCERVVIEDCRIYGSDFCGLGLGRSRDCAGIFYEINKGGIIADNLVYANRSRGIYISGSQNTWIVHNTVAGNDGGIVCMPRGDDWPLENVRVFNNLLIRNYVAADTTTRGCDLTIFMGCPEYGPYQRTVTSNHADYNVYANTGWTPALRHSWNPDNTLAQWQQRFQEDLHSTLLPVAFELTGTRFVIKNGQGLNSLAPLPDEVRAVLPGASQVGCRRTEWPPSGK